MQATKLQSCSPKWEEMGGRNDEIVMQEERGENPGKWGTRKQHLQVGQLKKTKTRKVKKKKVQKGGKSTAGESRLEISVWPLPVWDTCPPPGSHLSIWEKKIEGLFLPRRHVPGDRTLL